MILKLKNIISEIDTNITYDWESLRNSLIEFGYDTKNHKPISVMHLYKHYYLVLNGNHRTNVLRNLYDENYEIEVNVRTFVEVFLKISNYKDVFIFIILLIFFITKSSFFIFNYNKKKFLSFFLKSVRFQKALDILGYNKTKK